MSTASVKVLKNVLLTIKPSLEEQQHLQQLAKEFLKKINSKLADAQAILGGSGAKGTFLAGSREVDVYAQYHYQKFKDKSSGLSDLLEKSLKKTFPKYPLTRLHGSRDYFQINYEGYIFEVIPILKIKKTEEAKNITDISQLHALWVNKNIKDKSPVLLAKQFCKAHGMYGAESHIMGFSGYGLEILIGVYGTFEKLLKASISWKEKEVIDPEKHYKKGMALFNLNKSKQLSPIILIDPVDKNRNAAAALSEEKLKVFQKKAKEFLNQPSEQFFIKKEIDFPALQQQAKQKNLHLIPLAITPLTGKRDVVGAKILKTYHFLQSKLEPFGIKSSGWEGEKMYFIVEKEELPKEVIRKGPPLELTENVADFKLKNKDTFIKDKQIYARIQQPCPLLKDSLTHLLQDEYVKEKVKKIMIERI